ncbi:hypothetical protein GE21DRAFT_1052414 [Neurospora crassa]|nr:hypothetical protein GE21DRAFT_1052414 [Neurospora crassa]
MVPLGYPGAKPLADADELLSKCRREIWGRNLGKLPSPVSRPSHAPRNVTSLMTLPTPHYLITLTAHRQHTTVPRLSPCSGGGRLSLLRAKRGGASPETRPKIAWSAACNGDGSLLRTSWSRSADWGVQDGWIISRIKACVSFLLPTLILVFHILCCFYDDRCDETTLSISRYRVHGTRRERSFEYHYPPQHTRTRCSADLG